MQFRQLPSLNNLKAFAAAAQYGSFKQAAEALNVTPTAISHQIKNLEDHLGVTLFERKVRAITLTEEGEKLAKTALSIFAQLHSTLSELTTPNNLVRVSCCTSFATLWLAPRLPEFYQQHPNIQIEICANDQLIDITQTRQIDVAIRYGNRPCAESDEIYLATEYLQVYCAANAVNTHSQTNQTLFVTQWQETPGLANIPWQAHFNKNDFKITSFTQEHYVLQATLAGQGIGLLSNILSSTTVQQHWLLPMENLPKVTGYSYSLRLSRHAKNNHAARYFSEWMKKAM
ncbi:LysR family transcriptional regulator [Pseudoalteromonas citrea]|uniref:LysR family transcriptional regulator n=2 Tax=Pseudoalteromonas TaxID=53246 RepID=A0A5S3XLK1_9GAMM|nr:LysR family transcriptional regulator [Pseudoalteromonas citrea]TMP40195.1 LysR family transcriptional regulator [Pseudoalteromonas citrea]TMP53811.1 LysR family transcriptional regulator [Pseudoalteromonas citrea]